MTKIVFAEIPDAESAIRIMRAIGGTGVSHDDIVSAIKRMATGPWLEKNTRPAVRRKVIG